MPPTPPPPNRVLELAGSAAAAYAYTAYVQIGMIADASVTGGYDGTTCRTLLAEQRTLLALLSASSSELGRDEHTAGGDRAFLGGLATALERLGNMITALEAWLSSSGSAQQAAFEQARQDAWQHVEVLLGRGAATPR